MDKEILINYIIEIIKIFYKLQRELHIESIEKIEDGFLLKDNISDLEEWQIYNIGYFIEKKSNKKEIYRKLDVLRKDIYIENKDLIVRESGEIFYISEKIKYLDKKLKYLQKKSERYKYSKYSFKIKADKINLEKIVLDLTNKDLKINKENKAICIINNQNINLGVNTEKIIEELSWIKKRKSKKLELILPFKDKIWLDFIFIKDYILVIEVEYIKKYNILNIRNLQNKEDIENYLNTFILK